MRLQKSGGRAASRDGHGQDDGGRGGLRGIGDQLRKDGDREHVGEGDKEGAGSLDLIMN